jgi:2'-5' RNA ligase
MRLFVALVLSQENQRRLRAPLNALVQAHADVLRATPDGMAHLTLAFMGQVRVEVVAVIRDALHEVAERRVPFPIELSAPRVLRARQDPRLVLLPVVGESAQMQALLRDVHRAIMSRLPSLEMSPPKSGHVTLARFRKHARAVDAGRVEQSLVSSGLGGVVLREDVSEIHLFESTLASSGPKYRDVMRMPFAGAAGRS